jgi:hypothetical protein
MSVTSRQERALQLYYVEGWTHRRIGQCLGISHASVQRLIVRGSRWLLHEAEGQGGAMSPFMRALLAPSATSSPTRHVGRAEARQEELIGLLELRMQQRAVSLSEVEKCMSGESLLAPHPLRNHWDHWELCYLARRPQTLGLPGSAYEARTCWKYCAAVTQGGEG